MKVQFRRPENGTLRMLVRSAMSLPFVPVKRMEAAVNILQEIANSLEDEAQRRFGEKFMSYLHRQWLKNFDKEDLKTWNFYSKKGSYTNNPRYINEIYFIYDLIKILISFAVKHTIWYLVIALKESVSTQQFLCGFKL